VTRLAPILLMAGLAAGAARGENVDCRPCHAGAGAAAPLPDFPGYYAEPARHHPQAVAYPGPQDSQFRQPDRRGPDVAWFDRDGNTTADGGEVQLFGPERRVECASCHREHGAGQGTGPYLRVDQRQSALCTECHRK